MEALEDRWVPSTVTITNLTDVVDGATTTIDALINNPGTDGTISLREALTAANNTTGPSTITFDSTQFSTPQTITLTGGQLSLTHSATTTITGPGANLLSISGNLQSRVFEVDGAGVHLGTDDHPGQCERFNIFQ